MRPTRVIALLAALVLAAAGMRALRVRAMGHFLATQRYEDVYYLPPDEWLEVFSLDYREAVADLVWMKALVYFGDELVHHGQVEHVFHYANAIRSLDPNMIAVYRWVGMGALYHPGEITVDDMLRAVDFMKTGAARFPDNGPLTWDVGATLMYEIAPHVKDPARKKRIKEEALQYLETATELGAAPGWLALTNATELDKLGKKEQAARHLEEMMAVVKDEDTREQIRMRIAALRGSAEADAIYYATERTVEARNRELPYLPLTLYVLTGPRPVVDTAALVRNHFLPASADSTPTDTAPGP